VNRTPQHKQRSRKSTGATTSTSRRSRRPRSKGRFSPKQQIIVALTATGISLVVCVAALWLWGKSVPTTLDDTKFRVVELPPNLDVSEVLQRLEQASLIDGADLARTYQLLLHPWFEYSPGTHWLQPGHSAADLLKLLGRAGGRPSVRVVLPEGWDSFQMAERLAASGVCAPEAFLARALGGDGTTRISLEGHLYPASYDLWLDSTAGEVIERLNKEASQRFQKVFDASTPQLTRLQQELGLGAADVVTLASIVQKEAANTTELPLVASVFLNRLRDPNFRPPRMLQSDPTAAYGCKLDRTITSCAAYSGRVTPNMLRDPNNPFNTYKHAGLPPTPIGNPSTAAIEAVLNAPRSRYYFFVSPDGGPHQFSETLEAHQAATRAP
jgi:UPF0755 protein